jgi:hypothetical protein
MRFSATVSSITGLILLSLCHLALAASPIVHHNLKVVLKPAEGHIEVQDEVMLPETVSGVEFSLHRNLKPSPGPAFTLTRLGQETMGTLVPVSYYRIQFHTPSDRFSISYRGVIQHSLEQMSQDYGGDMAQTPGIIAEEGIFLSQASHWFPILGNERFTFSLRTELPGDWRAVSQGRELGGSGWEETAPQDDIYLIAAPYQLYRQQTPIAEAMVFLRQEDRPTAERYLDATQRYLEFYSRLLGGYPYAKFALVENFWETGYGMPSFTLLGPMVIRLPFIIHTSYPHEILHNWWGNGVYVDYASGNWSEGLTSYLADHLLREQQGKGAEYRRTSLQRYADLIAEQEDFPLTDFRGRHGQASQAIGYGKTLMFFHMLRQQLGDRVFLEGLRRFYRDNIFQVASFRDLKKAFEAESGKELDGEFTQWIKGIGAPALSIGAVETRQKAHGYHLTLRLQQTQPAAPFNLRVPIFIQLEGEDEPVKQILTMNEREATLALDLLSAPLRIKVDPQFDLFRRLDPSEIPSSLGQLFGAEKILVVLPADAAPDMKSAFQALAEGWAQRAPGMQIKWDNEVDELPSDHMVWLFGASNRWRGIMPQGGKGMAYREEGEQISIAGEAFSKQNHSFVLTGKNPAQPEQTLGWVTAGSAAAVPPLGRKLPHYMKYSYLVFEGDGAKNRLKGQWQLAESALSITLPGGEGEPDMKLPPKPPLSALLAPETLEAK